MSSVGPYQSSTRIALIALAEDQLDSLKGQIAVLEGQWTDQFLLIETQSDQGQRTAQEKVALQEMGERLALLRDRAATFKPDW